jgi:hypothetical protein
MSPSISLNDVLPHEQRTLVLTTYQSLTETGPDSVQDIPWGDVLETFKSRAIRSTKGGAAFSFLRLKPGTTRASENVEYLSAVVLDIDDGTPLEGIVGQLQEYEFLAVSTHSHTREHAKYRMIFPLSRDVPPERWPQIWQLTNQLINGHADPATKDCARLYFFPSCPLERKSDAFFHHNPGKWLDPDELRTPRPVNPEYATRAQEKNHPFIAGINLPPDEDRICRDGERTEHLASLIGHWIGEALDLNAVIEKARIWNALNLPPLPDGKVTSTCESIWKTHARKHAALVPGVVSALGTPATAQYAGIAFGPPAIVKPLFDVECARASRFFRTAPPPRTWILKDCLPAGIVGGIVASGGTGKSQAMLQLAAAVATGLPFCETWDVGEPGEVLALMAEDDDAELHRRMQYIARHLERAHPGHNIENTIGQNCVIKSLIGESNLLTKLYPDREVRQTDLVARVIATARQLSNLKLIILDPASRFRGGVENSAEDVTRFIEAVECIRAAIPGATVLIVHHTNKWSGGNEDRSQNDARGSSAFPDGLRWLMNLAPLNKKETGGVPAGERHMYLSATVTKSNYAPPQPILYLKRGEGGVLMKTSLDDAGGKEGGNLQLQILARVRDIARDGEPMSAEQFEKAFGGKTNVFGVGAVAVRGLIRQALDAGLLSKPTAGHKKPLNVTEAGLAALAVWEVAHTPKNQASTTDNARPKSANSTK